MISLSLRSAVRFGSWTSAGSSSRSRTSCWVIVDAPRLSPRSDPSVAEMMATGSNPALSQNVLSSTAVVASSRTLGISSNVHDLALGVAEACQLDLPRPVVDDRLLGQDVVLELARVGQVGGERTVDADRGDGRDGAKAGEEHEQDDGEPADGRRARAARSGAGGRSGGGHQEGRTPESGLAVPGG